MRTLLIKTTLILASTLGVFLPFELYFRHTARNARLDETQKSCKGCPLLGLDRTFGSKLHPNAKVTIKGKRRGHIAYTAHYSVGANGLRETPRSPTEKKPTRHALFLGCSFTFGESLNDNETLPYFFTKRLEGYTPYNYGAPGHGPQQMLLHLQSEALGNTVVEKPGIAIYTFIDHHVDRATGTMNAYNHWVGRYPHFSEDVSGTLINRGSFKTSRPIVNRLYRFMGKSEFLKYVDWPPHFLRSLLGNSRATFRIIQESARAYQRRFPGSHFIIVIFPGENRYADELKRFFANGSVKVFDYSERFQPSEEKTIVYGDTHPNATAYDRVAEYLVRDIGSLQPRFDDTSLKSSRMTVNGKPLSISHQPQ